MKVIICDFCKDKIVPGKFNHREIFGNKKLDLCDKCLKNLNVFHDDYKNQLKELDREYEEKREKLYDTLITKYSVQNELIPTIENKYLEKNQKVKKEY